MPWEVSITTVVKRTGEISNLGVLALLDFVPSGTDVAQASVVRHTSDNSGFSQSAAWIQTNFMGGYLSAITPD